METWQSLQTCAVFIGKIINNDVYLRRILGGLWIGMNKEYRKTTRFSHLADCSTQ